MFSTTRSCKRLQIKGFISAVACNVTLDRITCTNITCNGMMKCLYLDKLSGSSLLSELERDGFCQNPFFECLVAEVPEEHKSREGKVLIHAVSIVVFLVRPIYGYPSPVS